MKKLILFTILIPILLISGCEQLQTNQSSVEISEEKGILIDKLKFKDEGMSGEIIKNKIIKTAEVKILMSLNDSEEYGDLFGQQVTMAPFIINFACKLFATAFFNPTELAELQESGNLTIKTEEESPLDGYSITKSYMEFLDYEDKTKIADCTATGGTWEDIKFNAYRRYEYSLFGMQIGELPEIEEE